MTRHHIIISGTGRSGTTFLVQLFTALGLDTGFKSPDEGLFTNCNAGMELDIRDPNCPYIVKAPGMTSYLGDFLDSDSGKDVVIDHAIIPMRNLHDAAESRRDVNRRSDRTVYPGEVPGGLWPPRDCVAGDEAFLAQNQEYILAEKFHKLVYCLAKHSIPVSFLHFPTLANDRMYLFSEFQKIESLMPLINRWHFQKFNSAFELVSKPNLIHDFSIKPLEKQGE